MRAELKRRREERRGRVEEEISWNEYENSGKKRGAGEIYEMDESLFLREWCKRKGLFDDKDIKKTPYENLPKD